MEKILERIEKKLDRVDSRIVKIDNRSLKNETKLNVIFPIFTLFLISGVDFIKKKLGVS